MAKLLVFVALALSACTVPEIGSFDLLDRTVTLDDDGAQVGVIGCLSGIIGPCERVAGDTMTVTADGATYDVPVVTVPPDPDIIADDGKVEFQGTLPAPSDQTVDVALADEDAHVDLPPEFAITPPEAPVSRAASPIVIRYEVLPGAIVSADQSITCGTQTYELHALPISTPGELELPLADYFLPGTCQHAIQLHQRISLPADSLLGTSGRTETIAFTSNP